MLKRLHRILGLTAILFWLVQVVTGAGIETLWLIDSATYRSAPVPAVAAVLEQRLAEVRATGASGVSLWAAGTVAGQMKIFYTTAAGASRVRRLGTHGDILYDVSATSLRNREGLAAALSEVHETFLAGVWGRWLAAASGTLLVTNLLFGLRLALRGRLHLRLLLPARPGGTAAARRFQLHRMTGLWAIVPAVFLAVSGTVMAVSEALPAAPVPTPAADSTGAPTTPAQAMQNALAGDPGNSLSALVLPSQVPQPYELLMRTATDNRRFWGTTRVRISAHGDRILDSHRGADTLAQRLSEAVYPFHTGQIGGAAAQVVALGTSVAVLSTAAFGLGLWQSRRHPRPGAGRTG